MHTPFLSILLLVVSLTVACSPSHDQEKLQDLRSTVNELQDPGSFEEWHEAMDAFHKLAFEDLASASPDAICAEMAKWSNSELIAAEELLASRTDLPCEESLRQKIEPLQPLIVPQSISFLGNLSKCRSGETRSVLGPTSPVVLNTSGGKKMITGDLERCQVAFTFDDGPSAAYTEKLLDILAEQKVRVNFFTVGRNVSRLPAIVQKTKAKGHIWGNHSQTHANLPKLSNKAGLDEIRQGFAALLRLDNSVPPFFRFPFGAFTRYLQGELRDRNVAEFFWNMDTLDWKYKDPQVLYRNVLKEIEREKRGIILFHDVHPQTIAVVPRILEDLRLANYESVVFIPKEDLTQF